MMIARPLVLAMAAGMLVAAPAHARPPTLDWHPCATSGAECATLRLPVDWADPAGETFDLAVARRRATDPAARAGTLVFGPGGPGDSGTARIETGIGRFSAELQRRFDIVSFDPRGVGRSHAMPCGPAYADPVVHSQAEFDQRVKDNRALWDRCRDTYGALFDHAGTASTVRDLDALRAALGESRLTFHGSSYGTLLGEEYAERYPSRVRAIVLESSVDHSQDTGGFLRTQAWALQDSFDAFARWCAETACDLPRHDAHAAWARLMADADRGAINLSAWDLTVTAHRYLYGPDYATLAATMRTLLDHEPAERAAPPPPVSAVFCNDWALPVRDYRRYAQELKRAQTRDLRYSAGVMAVGMCLGWPRPVANPQHRLDVHTRTPLLQINARHDPASGYNWALSVSHQLGRSGVLLTYAGAGHGSYNSGSGCMRAAVDAYLIDLVVPQRGAVCPA
nr:alpha/beta hydrolase [Nucisporomicrobium flavum]